VQGERKMLRMDGSGVFLLLGIGESRLWGTNVVIEGS